MAFFSAKPEKIERISRLSSSQQGLYDQLQAALQGQGAGGAFGGASDYYRDLLSGAGDAAFEAPLQRQFQQETIPNLAEQFAGLGSGAITGGGFAQAGTQAATDLSERLGSIRAGLRQQGAQGLAGLGQFGLGQFDDAIFRPREPGLFEQFAMQMAPGLGAGAGLAMGGPAVGGLGALFSQMFGGKGIGGGAGVGGGIGGGSI